MKINALTDSAFLKTTTGRSTVRDVLLNAHKQGVSLSLDGPAFQFTAQLRLLASITAVALRHVEKDVQSLLKSKNRIQSLLRGGLPESAVDQAIDDLKAGCDPFDTQQPFMQRPPLPPTGPKDNSRKLSAGHYPVKKLSPSMLPDEGENYWNLISDDSQSLPLPDALLALVIYHHLSMAGNNAYAGDKCQMGSPAMRFVGADYTATEIIQRGDTLLKTLFLQIPREWVEGSGLPAWGDRTCEHSTMPEDQSKAHPLWRATWSSNTAACFWEEDILTGVRTGGIPEEWYFAPEMGRASEDMKASKALRKEWWDERNTHDPFYLYEDRDKGGLSLVRVDLGRDTTDLAVEWAATNRSSKLHTRLAERVLSSVSKTPTVLFAQHLIAGTASSPNIRSSEISFPEPSKWAFDVDSDLQDDIRAEADKVRKLHNRVCRVFNRKPPKSKFPPAVLDDMIDRKQDASRAFWRNIESVYQEILADAREAHASRAADSSKEQYVLPDSLRNRCIEASLRAFDEVVNPHALQEPARIAYVRAQLQIGLRALLTQTTVEDGEF